MSNTNVTYPPPIDVIPHRPPFLFIDHVSNLTDDSIEAWQKFAITESFFTGHFPQKPIVPGVILVEAMAQALAYWALLSRQNHWVLLTGIEQAKFMQQVLPDETVSIRVQIKKIRKGLVWAEATCWREEACVCKAELKGYLQAKNNDDSSI
jgi:UDP-3-O-[3-hydroxymyristoyl] N-acetylglucosamine deacetylase/3-hydroxyacyl-[acyl-carrier-protein] dehydratase